MRVPGRLILLIVLILTLATAVAGYYTLQHVRDEARRQAALDMERRIRTFWELLHSKGRQFQVENNKLLIGAYQINENYELPDKIRDIFGGTATIFMGDVRVSTNILREDGSRAVGTKLVGPAYDAIFMQGIPYRGEADILGKTYLTAYDPIRNHRGEVIGVLYVGIEKDIFLDHYDHLKIGFVGPIIFMALIAALLYLLLLQEGKRFSHLQEQHLRFLQTLIDALPIPVYYKDRQGRYLGCNTAFEAQFNAHRSLIVGKTIQDLLPADRIAEHVVWDQQLYACDTGTSQQFESVVQDADGQQRNVIFYKAAFEEADGVIGGIIGAILDITERKHVEERLRANERQMSDIISFLPDATWVVDDQGRVIFWNRACEEMTGVRASDIIGQGDYAYSVPFYGRRRKLLIDYVLEGGSYEGTNYSLIEQEQHGITAEAFVPGVYGGKGAYLWGTAKRLFDSEGKVVGAIETLRDITERKQTELREHARADILEHIAKDATLEDVLSAIAIDVEQERPDTFCSILLVNKQGTHLAHGAAPSLPEFYISAVNGLKIGNGAGSCGTAAYLRQRVIVADIENHPYWKGFQPARDAGLRSCWSEPILSAAGELYGTFALYSHKVWEPEPEEIRLIVTAANYASIAIERMKTIHALRESEHKYRELVENANSIILRMNTEGRITFFNEFAQQFFGYEEAEIIGSHVVGTIVPEYEGSGRNLAEMIAEICVEPEKYALNENENMLKNGERVFISWSNKASLNDEGGLEEILCIGQDITERRKMQELMAQSEKMMTVGGLAAGMAHELNNPIGTIAQHTQNIIRRISEALPANTVAARDAGLSLTSLQMYLERRGIVGMLEAINSSCMRAATIIANMLAFSRKSTTQMERTVLTGLVEKSIELALCDYDLKKHYDFKNITIVKEFDPDLPAVQVVPLEIEQVLLNLFKNAAQALASRSAGKSPTITVRLKQENRWAVIEVEDNGPGIDREHRNRIFEPFYTTKEVGVGTGLGLSISYSIIVNKHLGSISVASPPDKGACFTIRLPL